MEKNKNKIQQNEKMTRLQVSYLMKMVQILDNACIISVVLSIFSIIISIAGILFVGITSLK